MEINAVAVACEYTSVAVPSVIINFTSEENLRLGHKNVMYDRSDQKESMKRYLNQILNNRCPSGELVGVLTDSLLTIRFLGFLCGSLPRIKKSVISRVPSAFTNQLQ